MQPPWRLPGIEGGGTPPHQREWSGQGAALSWPREYAGEYHTNAQGLYKWALPCFLRRLLCSKILPSIEALSHFPAQLPRKFQSRNPDAPQTATGRRRAALTALGGPDAPQTATGRRRAALTALGGPDAPQTATGRRRAALTALGGPDAPQTATGRRRAALTALGGQMPPRPPQDAGERP